MMMIPFSFFTVKKKERVLLERIARLQKPRVVVWRGSGIPSDQQGTVVLHAQAQTHDENIWQCLGAILQTAQCRVVVGGFGPQKNASVCFWASWENCFPMILERHPAVAAQLVNQLEGHGVTHISAHQFIPGVCSTLLKGVGPDVRHANLISSSSARAEWQHEVASRVEESFLLFRCWFGTLLAGSRGWRRNCFVSLCCGVSTNPVFGQQKRHGIEKKETGENKQLVAGRNKKFYLGQKSRHLGQRK